ncbi:ABC transporter permease [Ornithinibacillus halotolerans]|uniref:ABC-2 type transporter transmembrane domain-containing protein n=1 Tax=Ornithinibacillus halotolerans TaxID=1274357 RepID=A0A916WCR2_9BACI|nr:ABC transporter permease [Ornithinibacillus halotolerans]GGA86398.1 hypothetical protein GCM10008025_31640 [Ornithinibacillus halotolerans]
MINLLYTRLLLWKRRTLNLLIWLLLPTVGTFLFITSATTLQEDARVPIAIVLEEESNLANELLQELVTSEMIHVMEMTEEEAVHELKQHDVDSVFIIEKGFENNILNGRRNNVLTSYRTDLSFAYSPVKEMIVSLVQEKSVRAKAALFLQREFEGTLTFEEIVNRSKQIQLEENLLNTDFVYSNTVESTETPSLLNWNTWGIWAVLSLLSTLFLMDWIIRERELAVSTRFSFLKMTRTSYFARTLFLYIGLFFLFDLISIVVFSVFLNESISTRFILELISFRIMVSLLSFGIAQFFKRLSFYYSFSILITLMLLILSGVIVPIEGFIPKQPLLEYLNPLHAFVSGEITIVWLLISLLTVMLAFIRKEIANA